MEPIFQAHPIPQNVTNFEFHLVGDMTLKQFGYLAAGLGLAFLVFTTLSTVQPIIAWPVIIISALLGVAFAFLPIQERPLDHWVGAFFRAIFKPTSLKYSSRIISPDDPLFSRRLGHYIKTYKYNQARLHAPLGNPNLYPASVSSAAPGIKPPAPAQTVQKKQSFMDKFKAGQTSFAPPGTNQGIGHNVQGTVKNQNQKSLDTPVAIASPSTLPPQESPKPSPSPVQVFEPLPSLDISSGTARSAAPVPLAPAIPTPAPQPDVLNPNELKKTVELAKEAQKSQQEIIKIEASLSMIKNKVAEPGVDPKSYIEQFEDLLTQLQKLNYKASRTAQELAEVSKAVPQTAQPVEMMHAKTSAPVKAQSIPTLKLTSFPNVLNGIVTDSRGNYIEGAIVVAHDKQGLPVRALKSNKLGQFVAATPLPNGEYSIVVEKDSLSFDKVGIELRNEILPPILVAAKKLQQQVNQLAS